jgi:hypothetical protein
MIKTSDQVRHMLEKNETLRSLEGTTHVVSAQSTSNLPIKMAYQSVVEPTILNAAFVAEARQKLHESSDTLVHSNPALITANMPKRIDVQEVRA